MLVTSSTLFGTYIDDTHNNKTSNSNKNYSDDDSGDENASNITSREQYLDAEQFESFSKSFEQLLGEVWQLPQTVISATSDVGAPGKKLTPANAAIIRHFFHYKGSSLLHLDHELIG